MENGYYVEWDYDYIPSNCDNLDWFETEAEAREYIRMRKCNPTFVCRLLKYNNGTWEII